MTPESVNRSGESGIISAIPGSRKSPEPEPLQDDVVLAPENVEGEFITPDVLDLRYVAWTVEETAHLLDPGFVQAKTYCGHTPRAGGPGRLRTVLFLDSPGNRKTCERCFRVKAARSDTSKA